MKTDLQKILSVSGESGLYLFLSQAKAGIIAESLITKKRTALSMNAKVTALSDISIYSNTDEISLKDLFEKMKVKLEDNSAPDAKSEPKVITSFFEEVFPEYDHNRFYPSHMKKVVNWYNILKEYASLDFSEPEEENDKAE